MVVDEMGVLGATNCAIRKSLWEKHHFDEKYGLGGEDGEWAKWARDAGYIIMIDPSFAVRHSHPMKNLSDMRKQLSYWGKLGKPSIFEKKELNFRRDLDLK